MPKTNANDMVMAWLDAKIHENPDSFDAINAENCLALIRKQKKQLISLGAHFCNLKKQRDKLQQQITIAEKHTNAAERHLHDARKTIAQEPVLLCDRGNNWLLRDGVSPDMEANKV